MKVKKKKRTPLTIANKLDIIHKLEIGVPPTAICDEFKVAKQTVSDIKKNKLKIKNFAQSLPQDSTSLNTKTMKSAKNNCNGQAGLEKELYGWCCDQSSVGLLILPSEIKATALQLAQDRGLANFSASNGWLWRFLKRNNMTTNSCQEKLPIVDEEMEDEKKNLGHEDYSSTVGETGHISNILIKEEVLSEDENGYKFEETSSFAEYSHITKNKPHTKSEEEDNASDSESLNQKTVTLPNKSANNLEELEKELYEWWSDQKKNYLLVRPSKIQAKALQLAEDRGLVNFSAGNGWLWRFLKRYNMTTKLRREKSPIFHEEVEKKKKNLEEAQESYKDFNPIVDSESSNCSTVTTNSPHADVFNIPSTSYTQSRSDSSYHKGYIDKYCKRNKVWSYHKCHAKKSRSILKTNFSKLLNEEDQLSEEMGDRKRRINNLDKNDHPQCLASKNMDENLENGRKINGSDENREDCQPLSKRRNIEMERISRRVQNNTNLQIDGIVSSLNRIEEQFCKMNHNLEVIAKALSNKFL